MDDAEQLLPRYLRFVRGIVDTRDLPLNVSREILQRNKVIDTIRAASIKKILGMLEGLSEEDYGKFWGLFGRVLKQGVIEDTPNQERVAKLLRFSTTHDDAETPKVTLTDYVSRMKEGQDVIYYLTGESFAAAKASPHLEVFRARGVEVLLLTDPVDEWLVQHLTNFEGKSLKSVLHGKLDLPGENAGENADASADEAVAPVVARIREALGDKVKEVRASKRLTSSPACLVADDYDMGINLQRILKAAGQEVPPTQRVLEINLEHPLLKRLDAEPSGEKFATLATVVYEQAVLAEGGRLEDAAGFVKRVNDLLLAEASS